MIPSPFEYLTPGTLEEALALLEEHGDNAKLLAGGHSLIPLMKLRFAAPDVVIDLGGIQGIREIDLSNGSITIGALTTHYAIESSDQLAESCPLLPETAAEIGDVQVRNVGTIGGSLVHADPAADWPATMLALDAELEISGSGGSRTLPASEFFLDMLTTALEPGEILTRIKVPAAPQRSGSAYVKMHQSASGFAIAGVAAQVGLDGEGNCDSVAVGITGVSSVPYCAAAVENSLKGNKPDPAAIASASSLAADGIEDPQEDHHASADYREHLCKVFARRALSRAVERAG